MRDKQNTNSATASPCTGGGAAEEEEEEASPNTCSKASRVTAQLGVCERG